MVFSVSKLAPKPGCLFIACQEVLPVKCCLVTFECYSVGAKAKNKGPHGHVTNKIRNLSGHFWFLVSGSLGETRLD